jgi:hypothetical protein
MFGKISAKTFTGASGSRINSKNFCGITKIVKFSEPPGGLESLTYENYE